MSSSSSSSAASESDDDWDKSKSERKEKKRTKSSNAKTSLAKKGRTKNEKWSETEKKSKKTDVDADNNVNKQGKKTKRTTKLKRDEEENESSNETHEHEPHAKKNKKGASAINSTTSKKKQKVSKNDSQIDHNNSSSDESHSNGEEKDNTFEKADKSFTPHKKTKEPKYQKKTQLEHILLRPDTYVGSIEAEVESYWVAMPEDESGPRMEYRKVNIVPGLYKIFDEILVNAADNKQRDEPGKKGVCMTHLEVTIDAEVGKITVKNDGKGISVAKHEEYPMCIPQLIFGELLTSSNYDDDVKQTVGGRNGFGAKLANIFSRKFVVEIEDATEKKSYRQVWRDNMSKVEEPVLTHYSGKKNSTSITFYPELRRFDMESLDSDILSLLRKRVYDIAGTTPDSLKVFLNGKPLAVPNFKKYTTLYIGDPDSPSLDGEPPRPRVYAALDRRWEVCVSLSNTDQFAQVSFVNNIATARGGSHVSYMSDLVSKAIVDLIGKTKGASKSAKELSAADVKKHLFLFVNALVVNPTFDSQTKTFLTSKRADLDQSIDPVTKKVSKVKVDSLDKWNAFVLSIKKSGLVQEIITRATEKAEKKMSKTDGKLKAGKRITGIPKLEDANLAGE